MIQTEAGNFSEDCTKYLLSQGVLRIDRDNQAYAISGAIVNDSSFDRPIYLWSLFLFVIEDLKNYAVARIFLDNIDHWWTHLARFPLLITNKVKTHRGERITDTPFRITFDSNDLPSCYSAFAYFKRDPMVEKFFKLLHEIVTNWETWSWKYTPINRQPTPSIDVAMGIAVAHMGLTPFTPLDYPTFTHMKPESWRTAIPSEITDKQIKIGNYIQTGILHYVDKDMVDELSKAF
jgi:hypothetical protein